MPSPHQWSQASVPAVAPPSRAGRASAPLALLLAAAAIAACSDGAIPTDPTLAAPGASRAASTVEQRSTAPATLAWQATARGLVASHPAIIPIVANRLYALVSVAQYAAAVASDEALGITGGDDASVTGADDGGRAQYESRRGAIGEASRVVLTALVPDRAADLQAQLDRESVGPNGRTHPHFTRGVDIGHAAGVAMMDWAAHDGFSTPWDHVLWLKDPSTPARWYQAPPPVTVPPTPYSAPSGIQYPAMHPYFLTSSAQFHPPAPPAFGSPAFNAALDVVRAYAALPSTDPVRIEQVRIARFWNLPQGTPTPLGYWDAQASSFVDARGLGDRSASHVFALTNATAMDATIGCWEAKYSYGLLRPFQNVPTNATVFTTPNHPSYPSGHSCVSAAVTTILESFFPDEAAGLEAQVAEAGLSRIYAGIHYSFDIEAGQNLGRAVARWALEYDRTPGLLRAVGR